MNEAEWHRRFNGLSDVAKAEATLFFLGDPSAVRRHAQREEDLIHQAEAQHLAHFEAARARVDAERDGEPDPL